MDLGTFRSARITEATAEAERLLAGAEETVEAQLEEARRTADAVIAQARADGVEEAEREMELVRAHGQRRTREIVLAARAEAYASLRERARAAALELRGTPGYDALLDRLEGLARRALGDEARIERDPAGQGGILAEAGGRRVDYSLAALVGRAIEELGEEVERLWT